VVCFNQQCVSTGCRYQRPRPPVQTTWYQPTADTIHAPEITEGIETLAHLLLREHTLLAPFKAADEFYNSQRATWKMYWQLRTSVSAGTPVSAGVPVSAAEPVSADDLHLAQLRRRTIGCQWRAWGAQESTTEPTGDKTKNLQMRITKARPRKRSSLLHNYMSSLCWRPADVGGSLVIQQYFLLPPC
jgi:hypothetical protein